MTETIRPGDVVGCLNDGWCRMFSMGERVDGPVKGKTYRVTKTGHTLFISWLRVRGFNGRYEARCFRKVLPAETGFTEQMRAMRPASVKEPT